MIAAGCGLMTGKSLRPIQAAHRDSPVISHTVPVGMADCMARATALAEALRATVFVRDPARNVLVLTNVPSCVDTTQVGLFFMPTPDGGTRIDVASRSERARETVSRMIVLRLSESTAAP
jgi:hypothetical protein